MGNPIEARAYAIIERRPLLRRLLLFTALVGIAKGAIDVFVPAVQIIAKPVVKLLPIKPSKVESDTFSCALWLPSAVLFFESISIDPKHVTTYGNDYNSWLAERQRNIQVCYEILDFQNRMTYASTYGNSDDRARLIGETRQNVLNTYSALVGHLTAKKPEVAGILDLADKLARLDDALRVCKIQGCKGGLNQAVRQRASDTEHAYRQAKDIYPYRMPTLNMAEGNGQALRREVVCWRENFRAALGLKSPTQVDPDPEPTIERDPAAPPPIMLTIVPFEC